MLRAPQCAAAVALILGAAACGITGPVDTAAQVTVQVDSGCASRITGAPIFQLIVDGDTVGTAAIAPGQRSHPFAVPAGEHRVEARVPSYLDLFWWGPTLLTMERGQQVTYLLRCPFFGAISQPHG